MDWHTEIEEDSKEEALTEHAEDIVVAEEEVAASAEVEESKKPEYSDYKSWSEIPEKERKYYGI